MGQSSFFTSQQLKICGPSTAFVAQFRLKADRAVSHKPRTVSAIKVIIYAADLPSGFYV